MPNLYSLTIETGALDYLFEFYKDCLPECDGYITEQGEINFSRAKKIFNLLAKKECICNVGLEHCNKAVIEQKKENEILRNRFDDLFNELDEYRKRNGELTKELKKLNKKWNKK